MNDERKFFTDGAAYERLMGRWSRLAGAAFLDWLAAPQGLRWLDVGCGNGAFSEVLMSRCPPSELHGIDPSDAQIAFARTREEIARAQFHVGDAQSLPFDDDRFDAATMALVIPFIPDPAKAVSEMVRVVRPGGRVASYMWDSPAGGLPAQPIHAAAQALRLTNRRGGLDTPVYARSEIQALWEAAGLQEVETHRIDIQTSYADLDDFWDSNTLLANPVAKMVTDLPAADRERVRAHLAETLPKDADGRISCTAFANAVKGRVSG